MTLPPLINSGVLSAVAKISGELLTHFPLTSIWVPGATCTLLSRLSKLTSPETILMLPATLMTEVANPEKAPPPVSCKLVPRGW